MNIVPKAALKTRALQTLRAEAKSAGNSRQRLECARLQRRSSLTLACQNPQAGCQRYVVVGSACGLAGVRGNC